MVQIRNKFHSLSSRTADMAGGLTQANGFTVQDPRGTSSFHLIALPSLASVFIHVPSVAYQHVLIPAVMAGAGGRWRTSISSYGSNTEVYILLLLHSIARTLVAWPYIAAYPCPLLKLEFYEQKYEVGRDSWGGWQCLPWRAGASKSVL